jgi:hypothetical protein
MPIRPILTIEKNPTVRLDPQKVTQRQETAAWIAQCIANWSWVESAIGGLFVNLLGTNLTTGAALYNDITSSLTKDRALRSVALTALKEKEYRLLEAILKLKDSHQRTRDKLAHWYWGVCAEISDGLVLVDPRYLMQYRAGIIDLIDKRKFYGAEMDREKLYVVRTKDLQADAHGFAALVKIVRDFANLVVEKNQEKRAQQYLALSNDARIQEVLARVDRSAQQKPPLIQPISRKRLGRRGVQIPRAKS